MPRASAAALPQSAAVKSSSGSVRTVRLSLRWRAAEIHEFVGHGLDERRREPRPQHGAGVALSARTSRQLPTSRRQRAITRVFARKLRGCEITVHATRVELECPGVAPRSPTSWPSSSLRPATGSTVKWSLAEALS